MKDPIRNYKKVLAGRNRDSDSDESQPLLSSSCSSSSSSNFGAIFNPSKISTESDEDVSCSPVLKVPIAADEVASAPSSRRKFECKLAFGSNFGSTVLDLYNAKKLVFEEECYPEFTGFSKHDPMSIQSNPNNILESPVSSGNGSYSGYMDYKEPEKHTHSSLVTIFAIWNTTMGSSLLAMSWGIQMAGLFPGIAVNILVAALCLYTCHLLLTVNEKHGMPGLDIEVSHLCQDLLGQWAAVLAKIFSVIVLLGADIVYMILMSNFLYNFVYFIYGFFTLPIDPLSLNVTVLCPTEARMNSTVRLEVISETTKMGHESMIERVWDLYSTVPIILSVIMFCVLNFKSPTFFTKFNSLGTISVLYLLIFVAVKAFGWGVNMTDWLGEWRFKSSFTALSGMLSLSYFIHNIIIAIMRNNQRQEHNRRDLTIAFGLITFTYLFIGIVFYISFPLAKSCIEDNILNNFSKNDILTIIARVLLLFQLFTVFPLISFMLRKDILGNINQIFKNYRFGDFTYGRVMVLNGCLLFICVLFACFLPKIGTLIRYTGALSGLVYIFMLPNLLKLASLRKEKELTTMKALWHLFIIVAGALNLLSQFFIDD
ncbi:neutral amino acid transporter 9-like [Euwallacea similis]|uniref:neutral amino acid transporter 9-like n=1 Tax=Euwallacea similis TaxID=1736056 RepID=UPI00344B408F